MPPSTFLGRLDVPYLEIICTNDPTAPVLVPFILFVPFFPSCAPLPPLLFLFFSLRCCFVVFCFVTRHFDQGLASSKTEPKIGTWTNGGLQQYERQDGSARKQQEHSAKQAWMKIFGDAKDSIASHFTENLNSHSTKSCRQCDVWNGSGLLTLDGGAPKLSIQIMVRHDITLERAKARMGQQRRRKRTARFDGIHAETRPRENPTCIRKVHFIGFDNSQSATHHCRFFLTPFKHQGAIGV